MVLSMVKEQFKNHYHKMKKVSDDEWKNLLGWWKLHEG
jgi:hypothetical protein